ncbi:DUF6817 domain-containing protein, partial [Streptomyces cirratus]
ATPGRHPRGGDPDGASPGLVTAVLHLLDDLGASATPHPGGTLGAHLQRVQRQLEHWAARPALQLAGLCHAFYGTDGFATAPLPLAEAPASAN